VDARSAREWSSEAAARAICPVWSRVKSGNPVALSFVAYIGVPKISWVLVPHRFRHVGARSTLKTCLFSRRAAMPNLFAVDQMVRAHVAYYRSVQIIAFRVCFEKSSRSSKVTSDFLLVIEMPVSHGSIILPGLMTEYR